MKIDYQCTTEKQILKQKPQTRFRLRSRPRMEKQQGWNSLKNGFWISGNNLGVGK